MQNNVNQTQNCPQKETICIDTRKIYDSCKDKECLTDLRVYLTTCGQEIINKALTVKIVHVELLYTFIDVEPIQFNNGFYTVDIKYFYRVTGDAFCGVGRPQRFNGLAFYQKRTILFGSEGYAKIYSSQYVEKDYDKIIPETSNLPVAVVEAVDPVVLDAKLCDKITIGCEIFDIPSCVLGCFDDEIDIFVTDSKVLLITLGQFSIVRLERDIQIVIPQCDICVPQKECIGSHSQDPCDLFETFCFPTDQFFPTTKKPKGC